MPMYTEGIEIWTETILYLLKREIQVRQWITCWTAFESF